MHDEIRELVKHLLHHIGNNKDRSNWKQVGILNADELLRQKTLEKDTETAAMEYVLLRQKADALKSQWLINSREWCNDLYKNHSLPTAGEYWIEDDGRILLDPKSLPKKGN